MSSHSQFETSSEVGNKADAGFPARLSLSPLVLASCLINPVSIFGVVSAIGVAFFLICFSSALEQDNRLWVPLAASGFVLLAGLVSGLRIIGVLRNGVRAKGEIVAIGDRASLLVEGRIYSYTVQYLDARQAVHTGDFTVRDYKVDGVEVGSRVDIVYHSRAPERVVIVGWLSGKIELGTDGAWRLANNWIAMAFLVALGSASALLVLLFLNSMQIVRF